MKSSDSSTPKAKMRKPGGAVTRSKKFCLKDRIRKIQKQPESFFSITGAFGDDEAIEAMKGLADKDWKEIFVLSMNAERQKFQNDGYSPEQSKTLVQPGWAWEHKGTLIAAHKDSVLSNNKPVKCIDMSFVHKGFRWEPAATLASLAKLKLNIKSPVERGSSTGSYLANRMARIDQLIAFASYIIKKHPEKAVKDEAKALKKNCVKLLGQMKLGGDLELISTAMNVSHCNTFLRIMIDSLLLETNRKLHVFSTRKKAELSGMRTAATKALIEVYDRTGRMPQRDEVLEILKPTKLSNGKYRFLHLDMEPRQFDRLLERIRKSERWRWQKGPESKRGRPRKK